MTTRTAAQVPDFAADRVAIAILAAVAITAAFTFRDYGLGWDDVTHSQYGDLLLKLYGSGFADRRALSFVNLYFYGGGFDMAAALAAKISPFGSVRDAPARRRRGRHHRTCRRLAARAAAGRAGRGRERARAARRLPDLLRPHVHEPEGRALRRRHDRAAARPGARLRRISERRAGAAWRWSAWRSARPSARACWRRWRRQRRRRRLC